MMRLTESTLDAILETAADLAATLERSAAGEEAERVRTRLRDSVVRPLRQASQRAPRLRLVAPNRSRAAGGSGSDRRPALAPDGLDERVWELALAATTLRVELGDEPALLEATAALQDLAIELADASTAASRLAELQRLQAGLEAQIGSPTTGPIW